ncbi:MAG: hypothetical protein ACYTXY_53385, partial [Nostoc sp.]
PNLRDRCKLGALVNPLRPSNCTILKSKVNEQMRSKLRVADAPEGIASSKIVFSIRHYHKNLK